MERLEAGYGYSLNGRSWRNPYLNMMTGSESEEWGEGGNLTINILFSLLNLALCGLPFV